MGLLAFALGMGALLGTTGLQSYFIDPYGIFPNPFGDTYYPMKVCNGAEGREIKSLQMLNDDWEVLLLGSSRVETAFDPLSPVWRGRKVFNGGLPGAKSPDLAQALEFAGRNIGSLKHVILAMELRTFARGSRYSDAFVDEPFFDGSPWESRLKLLFGWLSLKDIESAKKIRKQEESGKRARYCRANGFRETHWYWEPRARPLKTFTKQIGVSYRAARGRFHSYEVMIEALEQVRPKLEGLLRQGVKVDLFVNPSHILDYEIFYRVGVIPLHEQFKREIQALVRRLRKDTGNQSIRLFDFSGVNAVNTEPVPRRNDVSMRYYWETTHFRLPVADMIVRRILGTEPADVPADFGVDITDMELEPYFDNLYVAFLDYRENNQDEIDLFDAALADEEIQPKAEYSLPPPGVTYYGSLGP